MRKRIREKQSTMSNANCGHHIHPGRVWGILHVIKYHHWRHVKRRLTHRKHDGGRHDKRDEIPGACHDSRVDNMPEHYESNTPLSKVETELVHRTPSAKHSIKSRIKALLHEEIYNKKGRHKRSSTCPVKSQLTRADSIHHMEADPLGELLFTAGSPEPILEAFRNHPAAGATNDHKCVDCGTVFANGSPERGEIHGHADANDLSFPDRGEPEEEKPMNAKILTTDASPHLFKDFLDALDLINTSEEFLLKYMQDDPGSHSPFGVRNDRESRRASSISFPVPASSSGSNEGSAPSRLANKTVDDWIKEKDERKLRTQSHVQSASITCHQSSGNSHKVSPLALPGDAKTKHLMDLRRRIRRVIEERKKEKHRIAMDAVLDKIPRGNKLSKRPKRLPRDQLEDDPASDGEGKECATKGYGSSRLSSHSFSRRHQPSTMRASSLKESASVYSRLYETCFNGEAADCPKPESLRLRAEHKSSVIKTPRSFKRCLSLPNLKSYSHRSEDPSVTASPRGSIRRLDDGASSAGATDQQGSLGDCDDDSNGEVLPPVLARSASKSGSDVNDANEDDSMRIDGLGDFGGRYGASCYEQVTGPEIESTDALGEGNSFCSSDTSFLNDTFDIEDLDVLEAGGSESQPGLANGLDNIMAEQKGSNLDHHGVVESGDKHLQRFNAQSKRFNHEIPCIDVDPSHEAAFNYVTKVLELSGFTGYESLGIWYSDDQPVNPAVYEELEGCLLLDPDCSGNCDEGGRCNHLLLFDVVNEGLLGIFGRSYSYYPKPLSSLSRVHPLPVGDNVLQRVWALVTWYLNSTSEDYPSLDYYVSRDLAKNDGWMNLQFDSECVALELDDLIFDDLLEEII